MSAAGPGPRSDGGNPEPARAVDGPIDDLLRDLGGQLDAAEVAELAAEIEDRSRREAALLGMVDRLRGSLGRTVAVETAVGRLCGRLSQVGPDWLELTEAPAGTEHSALVPLSAVLGVVGVSPAAVSEGTVGLARRLDLRHVLRGVVRDRSSVRLVLRDGSVRTGTLDRAGADYVDLVEHAPDEPRSGCGSRLVPLAAIAVLRR